MTEPKPTTWSATTVTAAALNEQIRDSVRWILGHSANPKPHVRLRNSSAVSLTSGSWTDLTMSTATRDRGFGWTSGASLNIPVAGTYMIGSSVEINTAACNKALRLLKNGTTVIAEHDITGVGSAAVARISLATLEVFAGSDTVKAQAFQDSGSALNANSAGEFSPVIWCYYVATAS